MYVKSSGKQGKSSRRANLNQFQNNPTVFELMKGCRR